MNVFLSKPMVDEIFLFAEQLNRCQLQESEVAILQAIALTAPGKGKEWMNKWMSEWKQEF